MVSMRMSNENMVYISEFDACLINSIEYPITTSGIHKHESAITLYGIATII